MQKKEQKLENAMSLNPEEKVKLDSVVSQMAKMSLKPTKTI